jgi:hypothetical protein
MKGKSVCLKFFAIILSVCFFEGFAADELDVIEKAGFTIKPLSELGASENPFHRNLVGLYESFEDFADRVFVVTDYAKAPGKTDAIYAPPRAKVEGTEDFIPLSTMVLSRYNGVDGGSNLAGILDSWIITGLSCHAVVTGKGTIIYWVDPTKCKGQMAGPKWNACSVEILVATDAKQGLVRDEFYSLGSIARFANTFANPEGEPIKHMLSHGEACGSQTEGTIANIDEFRRFLLLNDAKVNLDYVIRSLLLNNANKESV